VNGATEPRLQGVYVALATPVTPDYEVDHEGLARLVEHVIAAGVDGISTLGSTGECASLAPRQRREVTEAVTRLARGRVTVLGGVNQTTLEGAADEMQMIADLGCAAALVPPPFYFQLDAASTERWYEQLAARVKLPIVVYSFPQLTKIAVPPAVVRRLAEQGVAVGVKDSSGDFNGLQAFVTASERGRWYSVLTGANVALLAALTIGAQGTIAATVNVAPQFDVALTRAFKAGDLATARDVQNRIIDVSRAVRLGVVPGGTKSALAALGLCGPTAMPPVRPLTEAELAEQRRILAGVGLLQPGAVGAVTGAR